MAGAEVQVLHCSKEIHDLGDSGYRQPLPYNTTNQLFLICLCCVIWKIVWVQEHPAGRRRRSTWLWCSRPKKAVWMLKSSGKDIASLMLLVSCIANNRLLYDLSYHQEKHYHNATCRVTTAIMMYEVYPVTQCHLSQLLIHLQGLLKDKHFSLSPEYLSHSSKPLFIVCALPNNIFHAIGCHQNLLKISLLLKHNSQTSND